jgi:hypothetical protein
MKYICDKILLIIEYEKKTYFKTKLWVEFFDEFLKVKDIYIDQLNLGPYINLKYWLGMFF